MGNESEQLGQEEIEQILAQAQGNKSAAPKEGTPAQSEESMSLGQADIEKRLGSGASAQGTRRTSEASPELGQNDIELLLDKAQEALASVDNSDQEASEALPVGMRTFELESFRGSMANPEVATLELMRDVQLDMTIELGRTHMYLEDVLQLRRGSVVSLNKLAGDPADIFVNGRLIARGEVLVLNDNFCIRVAELIAGEST